MTGLYRRVHANYRYKIYNFKWKYVFSSFDQRTSLWLYWILRKNTYQSRMVIYPLKGRFFFCPRAGCFWKSCRIFNTYSTISSFWEICFKSRKVFLLQQFCWLRDFVPCHPLRESFIPVKFQSIQPLARCATCWHEVSATLLTEYILLQGNKVV